MSKIISFLVTLWMIVTLTFLLIRAVPGDPFMDEQALPEEIHKALRQHYGLDDPWYKQYVRYLTSILRWDLGPSFIYKDRTVNQIIKEGFPVSAVLGTEVLFLAVSLGVLSGTASALSQRQWQDYSILLLSSIGISIPSFIIATLLQYIFAIKLEWFPVARWGTFMQTVLPVISLAALPTAFIARLVRGSMSEILQQNYIRTARAKGLSERTIIIRHAMRNAVLPVFSYLGQITTNILVGSFVIERIFGIPGLGKWFVISVMNRDYTVIMGMTVFYGVLLLVIVYLVDVIYGILDPKIRKIS